MSGGALHDAPVETVVIGGSAGGVDALLRLLPGIPRGTPVGIIVVLHVPRHQPNLLAEVFSTKCRVAVCEAEDKQPVRPGTVYFAPSNYHLLVDPGPQLALSVDEPVCHSRPSIDVLFESAAEVCRERLLGILLTGANEDGARGLAAVQRAGGRTIVQDPATAVAPQMVLAALGRCTPDHVLNLEGIARELEFLGADAVAGRPAE